MKRKGQRQRGRTRKETKKSLANQVFYFPVCVIDDVRFIFTWRSTWFSLSRQPLTTLAEEREKAVSPSRGTILLGVQSCTVAPYFLINCRSSACKSPRTLADNSNPNSTSYRLSLAAPVSSKWRFSCSVYACVWKPVLTSALSPRQQIASVVKL